MKNESESLIEKLYARRISRESGFWPWVIQRISGISVGILVILHLWQRHFGTEGKIITFQSSVERLHNPLWLVMALLLITGLLFHAINGTRGILLDYITSTRKRHFLLWISLGIAVFFFLVYLFLLLPFIQN